MRTSQQHVFSQKIHFEWPQGTSLRLRHKQPAFNFEFQSTVMVGMYYFNTRLLYPSHVLEIQFRDTCTKVAKFSLQYIIM